MRLGVSRYDEIAFLPDEDSYGLGESIRHYRVLNYEDVGLARGASDKLVARHAKDHRAIVLTRNVRDFLLVMRDEAKLSSHGECQAMRCHEGGGLLTGHRTLRRFNFERITRQLELNGHPIDWYEVYFLNLRVHIDEKQNARVQILPVCERCLHMHTHECERCAELRILELYQAQDAHDDDI